MTGQSQQTAADTPPADVRRVTLIVPCFNEQETLPEFHRRAAALDDASPDVDYRFLFVNDGSSDDTRRILDGLADRDPRVQVLHLARNQGHQIAVTAGLDFVDADAAIIIDADLQDPPELCPRLVARLRAGADVVHARRTSRVGETVFKRLTAAGFYRLLNLVSEQEIVADAGDFRAISRRVVETIRGFREPHRYLRGIFSTIGFHQETLDYERDARFAGETKYPLRQMMILAVNAIFSFSTFPIKIILWASLLLWMVSGVYVVRGLVEFLMGVTVHGWTSIVLLLSFYSGLILFCLSIIGLYVGRIFEQGKERPLYWLDDARNLGRIAENLTRLGPREYLISAPLLGRLTEKEASPLEEEKE